MNWKFCPNCGRQGSLEQPNRTVTRCTACGYIHYNNAKGSVAIAFVRDTEMLFSQRGIEPLKGCYDLPGGFIENSESAQEAAVREVKEEMDLDITPRQLQLVGVYHNHYDETASTIDVIFMLTDWDGQYQAQDDSAALEWKPFGFINDPSFYNPRYKGLDTAIKDALRRNTVQ